MTVINYPRDRRRKRSDQTYTAIRYQLEHIYENQQLESFVLGDSHGLVLACAGETDEASALAAFAPVLHKHRGRPGKERILDQMSRVLPDVDVESMTVRTFEVDGETLYLTSVGEESVKRQVGQYRAITGIRRILDQTAAAA
mgnify:CR=1 FL=1